jgi:hypothetical protein
VTAVRALISVALSLVVLASWSFGHAATAAASVTGAACGAADEDPEAGAACDVVTQPGKAVSVVKKLVTGHVGSAIKKLLGGSSSTASTALGLAAIVAWVSAGAHFSVDQTAKVLGDSTTPQLGTTWFSARYWRIAGIAALLTLPFLFAAAVQSLLHSDLTLLIRAAAGYLPLAMLIIAVAAPVTMLLMAATDQLSAGLSHVVGGSESSLTHALGGGLTGDAFLKFLAGLLTTGCAIALWVELVVREAAVYVIVLLLPLAFAAFVWPARRIWAIRAVELLVALILSKLVIVAVLYLGAAALLQFGHGAGDSVTAGLAGMVLLFMAAMAPWAVLRLVPLAELGGSAAGSLRMETIGPRGRGQRSGQERSAGRADDDPPDATTEAGRDANTESARSTIEGLDGQPRSANGSRAAAPERDEPPRPAEQPLVSPAAGATGGNGASPSEAGSADGGKATEATAPQGPAEGFEGVPAILGAPSHSWKEVPLGPEIVSTKLWPPDDEQPDEGPNEDHEPLPPPQDDGGAL